jgi:ABC-type transport system involved in multi-copper enzyme maturation permease subunit
MFNLGTIWGIAKAESRLTRRLARYWIFVVLGALFAAFQFAQFMFIYKFFSFGSASAATTNPHFFLANAAGAFLIVFYVGLIFLAFELRARDERERVAGVLDAKPVSNTELVIGRALGILRAVWMALAIVVALLALAGYLMGVPIHGRSIITMLVFFTIPAFVFMIGIIFVTTMLLKNRLIAAIAAIAIIAGTFTASLFMPFWSAPLMDSMGGNIALFPSDLLPSVIHFDAAIQRLGYLLMGCGLIGLAIALHPRRDGGSRGRRAAIGAALFIGGIALCGWLALSTKAQVDRQQLWSAAHRAALGSATPDIVSLTGEVKIEPGRQLDLDLNLALAGTTAAPREALMSFNPAMKVSSATLDGAAAEFSHEDGLLKVRLPRALALGETINLSLQASGEPDPWFAYADAAKSPYTQRMLDAQIIFLGHKPIIWEKAYVALLPGVRWLPMSGPDVDRGGDQNPADFFTIDLTVDVPEGFLVAGPGRRHELSEAAASRSRFQYKPQGTVPEVCLIASRFKSVEIEIEGVTLEALLHPSHTKNIDFFSDAAEEIEETLTTRFSEAAAAGLEYPYDGLTLVEVPIGLRGYGGGWRMDTTLIQPAMILSRENTFPTAWFQGDRAKNMVERAAEREGGEPRAKRQMLEVFFENDFNGGNPFIAAARSFFGFQTQGQGREALAMDYVLEQLTSEAVSEREGFFSVHFFKGNFGQQFAEAGSSMQSDDRVSNSYADVLIGQITSTNKIWDTMSNVSLSEIDPRNDPEQTINLLALKGGAMAESMLDGMGKEKSGQFLGALRERSSGRNYTREDILAAGETVEEDLSTWLDLWIDQTSLPGFNTTNLRYERLADDETGGPRYQLRVTIRNGESPAGLVRVEYRIEDESGRAQQRERSEPILIPGNSAVEYGLVVSQPLHSVRVFPYLALNRSPFNLSLPVLEEGRLSSTEPFNGMQAVEVETDDSGTLTVDDLDVGFSIDTAAESGGLRAVGTDDDADLDSGLPPMAGPRLPSKWSRMIYANAYGTYRRTTAIVRAGKGEKSALFEVEIPRSGRWELSFYLPAKQRFGLMRDNRERGTWKLLLDDGTGEREIDFDADSAESGWNSLGLFDVASGTVKLFLSDETDGEYVAADAIRWTPERRVGEEVAQVP